jgi:hypothetical protein
MVGYVNLDQVHLECKICKERLCILERIIALQTCFMKLGRDFRKVKTLKKYSVFLYW